MSKSHGPKESQGKFLTQHQSVRMATGPVVQIRPYANTDWTSVCMVYDLAKPDELHGVVAPSSILPLNADHKMMALFETSQVHVAEQAGHVLGFVGTRGNFVSWLFVHPAHRRRGIAQTLLQHALSPLHGAVTLNVAKLNHPALCLYERFGFTAEREFLSDFNGQPVLVIRLRHERVA